MKRTGQARARNCRTRARTGSVLESTPLPAASSGDGGEECRTRPWAFRRVLGFRLRGTSGMAQNGLSLSQMRLNHPLFVLSVTVPLEMMWMLASATL